MASDDAPPLDVHTAASAGGRVPAELTRPDLAAPGPVDIAVVAFPGAVPDARVTAALADAVVSGAADLPDGTSAAIVAWENVWAARLRQALVDAEAIVALHERIQPNQIAAALEAVVISD